MASFSAELGSINDASVSIKLTPCYIKQYKMLNLKIDRLTGLILETTMTDQVNTNQMVFENVVINQNLPDEGFEFRAPVGVKIVN